MTPTPHFPLGSVALLYCLDKLRPTGFFFQAQCTFVMKAEGLVHEISLYHPYQKKHERKSLKKKTCLVSQSLS